MGEAIITRRGKLKGNNISNDGNLGYLYNYGDECIALTGGWENGYVSQYGTPSLQKNLDHLYAEATRIYNASAENVAEWTTSSKVDLTSVNTLTFKAELLQGHSAIFLVRNYKDSCWRSPTGKIIDCVAGVTIETPGDGAGVDTCEVTINTVSISGSFYVSFMANATGSQAGAYDTIAKLYSIKMD